MWPNDVNLFITWLNNPQRSIQQPGKPKLGLIEPWSKGNHLPKN
jgi:hypothetical protein